MPSWQQPLQECARRRSVVAEVNGSILSPQPHRMLLHRARSGVLHQAGDREPGPRGPHNGAARRGQRGRRPGVWLVQQSARRHLSPATKRADTGAPDRSATSASCDGEGPRDGTACVCRFGKASVGHSFARSAARLASLVALACACPFGCHVRRSLLWHAEAGFHFVSARPSSLAALCPLMLHFASSLGAPSSVVRLRVLRSGCA